MATMTTTEVAVVLGLKSRAAVLNRARLLGIRPVGRSDTRGGVMLWRERDIGRFGPKRFVLSKRKGKR